MALKSLLEEKRHTHTHHTRLGCIHCILRKHFPQESCGFFTRDNLHSPSTYCSGMPRLTFHISNARRENAYSWYETSYHTCKCAIVFRTLPMAAIMGLKLLAIFLLTLLLSQSSWLVALMRWLSCLFGVSCVPRFVPVDLSFFSSCADWGGKLLCVCLSPKVMEPRDAGVCSIRCCRFLQRMWTSSGGTCWAVPVMN